MSEKDSTWGTISPPTFIQSFCSLSLLVSLFVNNVQYLYNWLFIIIYHSTFCNFCMQCVYNYYFLFVYSPVVFFIFHITFLIFYIYVNTVLTRLPNNIATHLIFEFESKKNKRVLFIWRVPIIMSI